MLDGVMEVASTKAYMLTGFVEMQDLQPQCADQRFVQVSSTMLNLSHAYDSATFQYSSNPFSTPSSTQPPTNHNISTTTPCQLRWVNPLDASGEGSH